MRKKVFKGKKEKKRQTKVAGGTQGKKKHKNVFAKWNQNSRSQRENMNSEGKKKKKDEIMHLGGKNKILLKSCSVY